MKHINRNIFRRFRPNVKEFTDSGLSNQLGSQSNRLLNPNGQYNVKRTGRHRWLQLSVSHELITMEWRIFIPIVIGFYILLNLIFASLYYMVGMDLFMGTITQSKWDDFLEAFFFSAQTITTVGYGRINPVGFWPNLIASFEALLGLLSFAIVTGLVYGRFSRPVVHLLFSDNALISPYKDGKGLMFRIANSKTNDLAEVEAQVILSLVIYDGQNYSRKYYELQLERKNVNALALSWTIVHPITETSPMWEITPEILLELEAELLVNIKGFDTTFSQVVFSRSSYHSNAFVWNAKFRPAFRRSEDGKETILELDRLNDFEKLPDPPKTGLIN